MNFSRLQKVYNKYGGKRLDVKPGQYIEVHEEVGVGNNKRIWKFRGLVIKTWKPNHPDGTFTMRGTSSGVVVEKIYPFSFAHFKKVLLLDEFKVRRAKLYFIRDKVGKGARMKSLITSDKRGMDLLKPEEEVKEEVTVTEEEVVTAAEATIDVPTEATPEAVETAPEVKEEATPETKEEAAPEAKEEAPVEEKKEEIPAEEKKEEAPAADEAPEAKEEEKKD